MKKEVVLKKDAEVIDFNQFRKGLATGGPTTPEDWLSNLKEGSIFVAKSKVIKQRTNTIQDLILELFFLQQKKEFTSNLIYKFPDERQIDIWVKNLEFSRSYDPVEVLAEIELVHRTPEEQEEFLKKNHPELTDGNSDGSVRPSGLQDDATPKG